MTEKTVTITLTENQADALSGEISDWACWSAGFRFGLKAADGFDSGDFKPSIENLRELNIKLKSAQRDAFKPQT